MTLSMHLNKKIDRTQPVASGMTTQWLTNDFRSRLRVAMAVACAKGTAEVMLTAGKHHY